MVVFIFMSPLISGFFSAVYFNHGFIIPKRSPLRRAFSQRRRLLIRKNQNAATYFSFHISTEISSSGNNPQKREFKERMQVSHFDLCASELNPVEARGKYAKNMDRPRHINCAVLFLQIAP